MPERQTLFRSEAARRTQRRPQGRHITYGTTALRFRYSRICSQWERASLRIRSQAFVSWQPQNTVMKEARAIQIRSSTTGRRDSLSATTTGCSKAHTGAMRGVPNTGGEYLIRHSRSSGLSTLPTVSAAPRRFLKRQTEWESSLPDVHSVQTAPIPTEH